MAASASPCLKRPKLSAHHRHKPHHPSLPFHSAMNNNHHQVQKQEEKEEEEEEEEEEDGMLIPGLPDDLTKQCLARLPPSLIFSVCHPWRRFLYSSAFPSPHFSLYSLMADSDSPSDSLSFFSFDPLTAKWDPLPPPPLPSPLILQHPSFISRLLPVQSLSSHPYLLLLSASNPSLAPALPCPLVFHPSPPRWQVGPSFPISPRRWCAAGSSNGSVFIFSGVGSLAYDPALARSAFKWDLSNSNNNTSHWKWDPLAPLRDGTFSREAVEAVASNGKLCMVNLRGRCAKEGLVYNIKMNKWAEMPTGLRTGWTGPAAADEEGNIYVVDEASGALKVYQWGRDTWVTVFEGGERLRGATQLAARGEKVCVVLAGGEALVVVDVGLRRSGRGGERGKGMWSVEPPCGKKILNVNVLPRLSRITH
ncbi:hypothetical protein LUZ60_007297 [Juncus effusus]|nr:hypothetical protein LUZ60_007297 [Juncus effusus]